MATLAVEVGDKAKTRIAHHSYKSGTEGKVLQIIEEHAVLQIRSKRIFFPLSILIKVTPSTHG